MRKSKVLSNAVFLARVREYLPMDAAIRETDSNGKQSETVTDSPSENTFYLLDAEAVQALSFAIEEIALEDANGHFLAAIQDFKRFGAIKEHYWQLGATLEHVQVIAAGKTPPRNGHVKFCPSRNFSLKKFWVVLYQGRHNQIMLLCQQVNQATKFEEKKFLGCYTFDRHFIEQTRQDITALLAENDRQLHSFEWLRQIDHTAKRLKSEFAREQQTLEAALGKLRQGRQHAGNFVRDLDKTLQRLNQLKVRLPEMITAQK